MMPTQIRTTFVENIFLEILKREQCAHLSRHISPSNSVIFHVPGAYFTETMHLFVIETPGADRLPNYSMTIFVIHCRFEAIRTKLWTT